LLKPLISFAFHLDNQVVPYRLLLEVPMSTIRTASWFARLPAGAVPVSASRGAPRGKKGFQSIRELQPGPWFKSVTPRRYLELYTQILDILDPCEVQDRLLSLGETPVLLCWESAADCHAGKRWCHRHVAAQWLEDRLGIAVEEVGHPKLDRFALLRNAGIPAPDFHLPKLRRRSRK
jgi:hypothetical protein